MAEMQAGHFLAPRVAPVGKAEFQIDMYDALAPAGDLVQQPAEAVAEPRGQTVRQQGEQLQEADGEVRAEAA
jgi:hypothetical protein